MRGASGCIGGRPRKAVPTPENGEACDEHVEKAVRKEKCRRADIFDFLPIKRHQKRREVRTLQEKPVFVATLLLPKLHNRGII